MDDALAKSLGIPKSGFHAFRRFRATHLRKSRSPESLVGFGMGHSAVSITDIYDKSYFDDLFRQTEAERMRGGI